MYLVLQLRIWHGQKGFCESGFMSDYSFLLLMQQINPPHYIPLVEVIPAPWTDPSVVARTVSVMKDLGQCQWIHCQQTPVRPHHGGLEAGRGRIYISTWYC